MGVEKVIFYSVRCNKCNCLLEDYTGELARLTLNRTTAERAAKENGFVKIKANIWLCPTCKNISYTTTG